MIESISKDIVTALKNREKDKLLVLRSIKSALKNREIEIKKELSEEESVTILRQQVKQREQAIELYERGNRQELADKERSEIKIIRDYLPKSLSEAEMINEVELMITELKADSMKDMGRIMKALSAKLGGSANGKILSNIVRAKLS
ncbi:MAG: GatB/YqeY domain-containing protein [Candidatus Cloacimonetes bacterium]|nr:GatB/YqeY domain-containing protein [Candidatus Cloacimonadota bacterium]